MKNITLTFAACHQGQRKKGVEYGFTSCLSSLNKLIISKNYNFNYLDFRSGQYFNDPIYGSHVMGNNILEKSSNNSTLITIGGDHTISYGSITASLKLYQKIKVIWIDAHPDLNTPSSSLSGNCHGMPVSYLLGLTKDMRLLNNDNILPKDFAYIGLRSIDLFEENVINNLIKAGLIVYTSNDVKNIGIKNIIQNIITQWNLEKNTYKFHISLDIDSMDPIFTPATGTPVKNGLYPNDVKEIIKFANQYSKNDLANLDITEINPLLSDIVGICQTYNTVDEIFEEYIIKNVR